MDWTEQKLLSEKPKFDIKNMTDDQKLALKAGGLTALITFVMQIGLSFLMLKSLQAQTKVSPKFTKALRKFMKDGKSWNVYIFPEKIPNAFVIMGKSVFVTQGLAKMMTDREVMAVMLHEIGHLKNKDVLKSVAGSSFLTGLLFGLTAMLTGPALFLTELWLYVLLGEKIFVEIFVGRTYGRHAENKADSYAVKHGLADELVSALNKLQKFIDQYRARERKKHPCGKLCQWSEKIGEFLDEHPPMKKRTETILKKKETWQKAASQSITQFRNYLLKQFGVKKPEK